jgi:hypothetical protein
MSNIASEIVAWPAGSEKRNVKVWDVPAPEEGVEETTAGGRVATAPMEIEAVRELPL